MPNRADEPSRRDWFNWLVLRREATENKTRFIGTILSDAKRPREHLDEWLGVCAADGRQQVREKYLELSDLLGRNVKISCDGRRYSGRVVDLEPFKGILVQLDHGGVRLFTPANTSLVG